MTVAVMSLVKTSARGIVCSRIGNVSSPAATRGDRSSAVVGEDTLGLIAELMFLNTRGVSRCSTDVASAATSECLVGHAAGARGVRARNMATGVCTGSTRCTLIVVVHRSPRSINWVLESLAHGGTALVIDVVVCV
jgi:hypothetical protein